MTDCGQLDPGLRMLLVLLINSITAVILAYLHSRSHLSVPGATALIAHTKDVSRAAE